ncbi:hypothetical protein C4K10_4856 [Pseudomonas chlororaphis subsp. aureofaciens]|nr:hypothetical protein C4K10_4856 [Pseudomonas chlororaphis subsp. aureofaciens]AZE19076.1 hypothetical protein C4K09_4638 [Pseudomonas chlororaphis subsp. aureofaciens]PWY37108.1 hypothetical protein DK261_32180 [Pseudomonas sp. RW409]
MQLGCIGRLQTPSRHAGHTGATLKRRGSIPRLGARHTRRQSNQSRMPGTRQPGMPPGMTVSAARGGMAPGGDKNGIVIFLRHH